MSVLTLSKVIATHDGFHAEGTVDAGSTAILSLQIQYRIACTNTGTITDATTGARGAIRLRSENHGLCSGDKCTVEGVRGTVEANGDWKVGNVSSDTFDLAGSSFTTQYTSGGTWRYGDDSEHSIDISALPLSSHWAVNVRLERNLIYTVRARLLWLGSPSVIHSNAYDVDLRQRPTV